MRRDPGLVLALVAVVIGAALYVPSLAHGTSNYDDPWLIQNNWIVRDPSWASQHAIWFDTSVLTRATLGAEYLPIRDLSVMLDAAIWGDSYGGYHLTNVLLYAAAIWMWFCAFVRLGIDRRVAGLAALIWAVHPSHAESVAWLAERKGLLAAMFSAVVVLGYARYRSGGSARWLVLAVVIAPIAVWSKALAAFTIAALGAIEWLAPEPRISIRRSLVGLAAIALSTAVAFVPVLVVARKLGVVGSDVAPVSPLAIHGFDLRLAAGTMRASVSYPIPGTLDVVLGVIGVLGALALVVQRRWPVVRIASVLWLFALFPSSRLVLPVRQVVMADRYLLLPTLGIALLAAVAICAVRVPRRRVLLGSAIVLALALRAFDAQSNWRDSRTLWARATEVNPADGDAWSMYVEALLDAGDVERAQSALTTGLGHSSSARLEMHQALLFVRMGNREQARVWMRRAAEGGEPRAMANLALFLVNDGKAGEAASWAQRSVDHMPAYAAGYRALGKARLTLNQAEEARGAFALALRLEPSAVNHYNLALALLKLGRRDEARMHLLACENDPALGPRAKAMLASSPP